MHSERSNFLQNPYFKSATQSPNQCVQYEKTWSNEGQLEILAQVSLEQCYDALLENENGVALTFYQPDKITRFENVCIIFGSLHVERSCKDCISIGTDSDFNCDCQSYSGYECTITDDNFIKGSIAKSTFECQLQCLSTNRCYGYTWFGPENEDISNECFMYSSCSYISSCIGCYGGVCKDDGYTTTRETTTASDTTTTTPTTTAPTTKGSLSYRLCFEYLSQFKVDLEMYTYLAAVLKFGDVSNQVKLRIWKLFWTEYE